MKKLFILMFAVVVSVSGVYAVSGEKQQESTKESDILIACPSNDGVAETKENDAVRSPAEQKLIALSRNKWELMAEKNVEELAKLFHDEAQFVHMGGYWGKEQELGIIRSGGIWYKEAEIHSVEVKFTKNTAVVYSRIHLNAVVGGNEVRNPFIVSEVYVKENGKWLLSVLAFTKTMGR